MAKEKDKSEREKRYKDRKKEREDIENSLLDQLEDRKNSTKYFIDLVKDYMSLWDIKNELIFDVEEKGVSVKYQNGENQWGYKKNDSVRELTSVNAQMLKLLKDLGIKAEVEEVDDNEFDL